MTRATTLAAHQEEVDPMWILCDNESTVDIFSNKNILNNIQPAKKPIQLKEGTIVNQEGDLLGYGTVYYSSCVAANFLSFFKMTKRFKAITYDNRTKDAFQITCDDDSIIEFKPSPEGLYYYDFADSIRRKKAQEVDKKALAMAIQTVEELKRNFTKRER